MATIDSDQVVVHRANTSFRLLDYITGCITTVEADLVRVADTNEFLFMHPLEVQQVSGLQFLDDGTVAPAGSASVLQCLLKAGADPLSLGKCREMLETWPKTTLLCEVKVAQQGEGLARFYPEIRRQLGEEALKRFVITSFSRRELHEAEHAGFRTGLFTGDDPGAQEFSILVRSGIEYYLPDQYRIRESVISALQQLRIKVVPYVVNDRRQAEKLLSWGCDAVLSDRAIDLVR